MIQEYSAYSLPSVPPNMEKAGYGSIRLQKTASLFNTLDKLETANVIQSENPLSMESVGQVSKEIWNILSVMTIQKR